MDVFTGIVVLVLIGAFGALIYGLFFEKERHFDERNFDGDRGLSKDGLLPLGSGVTPLSSHATNKGPHFVSAGIAPSRSGPGDGGLDAGDIILGAVIANQFLSSPPESPPEPELEHTEELTWTHHEHLDSEPAPSDYSYSSSSDYSSSDSSSSYDSGSSDSGSSDSGGGD
jgi:hypothetical protein